NSRIDLLLEDPARGRCYVEVKNATLGVGGGMTRFPDAVTARGTKHLRELMGEVQAGHRAVLVFCASRTDTRVVGPADDIDPVYGQTLRQAAAAGVELMAWRVAMDPLQAHVVDEVPVVL
ncbi:MAG: DNA/RNA nuclease SfsA, partial [Myxococcales bacterium]|nr:DNA/RNA nuclease SfsA [Myxococcales bacterium]